mmetsp:Transcript_45094/g.107551  ORF Transcript_45094/g.107551 Transcript_45094/m.107551 type:complete len:207 (-) Transcript_45094:43-663(-)
MLGKPRHDLRFRGSLDTLLLLPLLLEVCLHLNLVDLGLLPECRDFQFPLVEPDRSVLFRRSLAPCLGLPPPHSRIRQRASDNRLTLSRLLQLLPRPPVQMRLVRRAQLLLLPHLLRLHDGKLISNKVGEARLLVSRKAICCHVSRGLGCALVRLLQPSLRLCTHLRGYGVQHLIDELLADKLRGVDDHLAAHRPFLDRSRRTPLVL